MVSSINGAGKTEIRHAKKKKKKETRPPNYTIHQNKFKMDKRIKCKSWYHKILEENIGNKISDTSCSNIFANISLREREIKEKLTSLKCPYYPKQSIDSTQLLSRFQWHVLQN